MATYPQDQFDDIPDDLDRVGAHRGPKTKGSGWVGFAWAAVATGVLVVGGLYYLSQVNASISFTLPIFAADSSTPTPTATPTPTVTPVTDPTTIKARKITITVLNATPTVGLEKVAAKVLTDLKWSVPSATVASTTTITKTVIYYSNKDDLDVATGIQLALGFGKLQLSDAYKGAPITVVLGSDYAP
jgi:hypothetical protein